VCSYFFTDNKGKITSKGVELETMVKASPEITLAGSASYNSSKANGDIPTVGAFDGDQTPYYPAWTASGTFFYDTDLGHGSLHLQASYQYQSQQYTTFNNFATTLVNGVLTKAGPSSTYAVIPETHNVSASLAYDVGQFEFGIYGTNLVDGVKITNIGRATYYAVYQAGDRVTYARPRTIGVRAKVKF
jgi:outer membrane receptor protein involved in Fe transport